MENIIILCTFDDSFSFFLSIDSGHIDIDYLE